MWECLFNVLPEGGSRQLHINQIALNTYEKRTKVEVDFEFFKDPTGVLKDHTGASSSIWPYLK